jgi:hypothetical protein
MISVVTKWAIKIFPQGEEPILLFMHEDMYGNVLRNLSMLSFAKDVWRLEIYKVGEE